jgi:hypothetical protein
LVGRDAPSDAAALRQRAQFGANCRGGQVAPARRSCDDAEDRAARVGQPLGEPAGDLRPAPRVHADDATLAALAVADRERPGGRVEIALFQGEGFADAKPGSPQHDYQWERAPTRRRARART